MKSLWGTDNLAHIAKCRTQGQVCHALVDMLSHSLKRLKLKDGKLELVAVRMSERKILTFDIICLHRY